MPNKCTQKSKIDATSTFNYDRKIKENETYQIAKRITSKR